MEFQLPHRLAVSKVGLLKSNMVAGLDEWLEEFLVPADVAAAFSAEGFSKVTHAIEHKGVGVSGLDAQVLLHHRGVLNSGRLVNPGFVIVC